MATLRLFVMLLLFLVALTAPSLSESGVTLSEPSTGDPLTSAQMVDAFDRSVQKRFHNVLGFGMARIATDKFFVPETDEEKAAVKAFKEAKLNVALYLTSRLTLGPKPSQGQFESPFFDRAIKKPLYVSSNSMRRELPSRFDLWDCAAESLYAFSQGKESYESIMGQWNVSGHPVRATAECVNCHFHTEDHRVLFLERGASRAALTGNKVQPGDPIGALLYVYKDYSKER
jgi:hypothetical protein